MIFRDYTELKDLVSADIDRKSIPRILQKLGKVSIRTETVIMLKNYKRD